MKEEKTREELIDKLAENIAHIKFHNMIKKYTIILVFIVVLSIYLRMIVALWFG